MPFLHLTLIVKFYMSNLLSILFQKMSFGFSLSLSSHAKEIWEKPEIAFIYFGYLLIILFGFALFVFLSEKLINQFIKKSNPTSEENPTKKFSNKFLFYCSIIFLAIFLLLVQIYIYIDESKFN